MTPDWTEFFRQLQTYPPEVHNLLPPCAESRIEAVQQELGRMPDVLVSMVKHFGGAELFCKCGPLISIFGLSNIPSRPPLEWASDWYIDKFTPIWRSSHNRMGDWVIGMTNYGGLIVLDEHGTVREWDTAQNKWSPMQRRFDEWLNCILRGGDAYMKEE